MGNRWEKWEIDVNTSSKWMIHRYCGSGLELKISMAIPQRSQLELALARSKHRRVRGFWTEEHLIWGFIFLCSNEITVVCLLFWNRGCPTKIHVHYIVWQKQPFYVLITYIFRCSIYIGPWVHDATISCPTDKRDNHTADINGYTTPDVNNNLSLHAKSQFQKWSSTTPGFLGHLLGIRD